MARDIEEIKDRIAGCFWGQAIGDALGLGTEFMSRVEVLHNYPEGLLEYSQFGEEFGIWTDDTDMMLCVARAIIADKDIKPNTIAHNFKEWYKSSPVDIGGTTARILSLFEYEESPYIIAQMMWERSGRNNAANGGVMRTSVVGLWNEDVVVNAERICKLTHADPRCIGSCVIISELINSLVWQDKELSFEELLQIGNKYDSRVKPYLERAKNGFLEDALRAMAMICEQPSSQPKSAAVHPAENMTRVSTRKSAAIEQAEPTAIPTSIELMAQGVSSGFSSHKKPQ